jgi:hypothetical protein
MLLDLEQVEPSHFPKQDTAWGSLFGRLDDLALEVGARLAERAARGQFFTPTETARFMAGLFSQRCTFWMRARGSARFLPRWLKQLVVGKNSRMRYM